MGEAPAWGRGMGNGNRERRLGEHGNVGRGRASDGGMGEQ